VRWGPMLLAERLRQRRELNGGTAGRSDAPPASCKQLSNCPTGKHCTLSAHVPQGVKKFVHVTSIGCDDPLFPLNAYWVS